MKTNHITGNRSSKSQFAKCSQEIGNKIRRRCESKCRYNVCISEICSLLGYYAALCGNCLPTLRDNVSVPSSRVKSPTRNIPEGADLINIAAEA